MLRTVGLLCLTISFAICAPVDDLSVKAFVVDATVDVNIAPSLDCLKNEKYQVGFLNIYENDHFVDSSAKWIKPMSNQGFKTQFIIRPKYDSSEDAAANIIKLVKNRMSSAYNTDVKFLWLDTKYLSQSSSANINFITSLESMGKVNKIKLGMITSKSNWQSYEGDWNGPAAYDEPLWCTDAGVTSNSFVSFGDWNSPTVINGKSQSTCFTRGGAKMTVPDALCKRSLIA